MPFAAILIGAIIVIAAINNSHGALAQELETDIPGYFKWAVAIAAILSLGFAPGMKVPSRWLLALVLVVLVLTNYQNILAGFTGFASSNVTAGGGGAAQPAAGYVSNPQSTPTQSEISGSSSSAQTSVASAATKQAAINWLDPASYTRSIGFGGVSS